MRGSPGRRSDNRAKKLYRGVLQQEEAWICSTGTATPQIVKTPSTTGTVRSPVHVRQVQQVTTPTAQSPPFLPRAPRVCDNRHKEQAREDMRDPRPLLDGPPLHHEADDRPWTADDTRALALTELQAPASMAWNEELSALVPRRSGESVGRHRR
ncbi:unnamed protein product, partial [Ixodes hexagonus]